MPPVCKKLALLTRPSNSIASCGALCCFINALVDGAEGLHFRVLFIEMQEVLVVDEQTVFGDETLKLIGRECPNLRSAAVIRTRTNFEQFIVNIVPVCGTVVAAIVQFREACLLANYFPYFWFCYCKSSYIFYVQSYTLQCVRWLATYVATLVIVSFVLCHIFNTMTFILHYTVSIDTFIPSIIHIIFTYVYIYPVGL